MLPADKRLNRKEIEEVLKKGKTLSSSFFRVKYLGEQETFKAGPVVSKKVAKTAVERNTLRRAIYETVGGFEPKLSNKHLAIFAQKGATKEICNTELPDLLEKVSAL